MLQAVTFAFEYDQLPMMGQAIDHGRGHLVVSEDSTPFGEFEIGRNDQTPAFIAGGHDLKEELRLFPIHGEVSPLVNDDEIGFPEFLHHPFQRASPLALAKPCDQGSCYEEACGHSQFTCLYAQCVDKCVLPVPTGP